jgi:hypothetical protein
MAYVYMSNAVIDLDLYKRATHKFKALCKKKTRLYQQSLAGDMCCANGNPNDLWRNVKRFVSRNRTDCPITFDVWVNYFQGLLSDAEFVVGERFYSDVSAYLGNVEHAESVLVEELDDPMTFDEIVNTVCKLKNSKAGGPGGLDIEMVKHYLTTLLPCVYALHNNIFQATF